MANEVDVVVKVKDQTKEGSAAAEHNVKKVGTAGKASGLALKAGLAVGAGGVLALGKFMFDGVKAAASYQTLQKQTAQVIKSTGNAAHISVKGVQDLAGSLESMSGVDEELIIHGENVLATFTNIRNVGKDKIFDMATQSALDMSVALKQDMGSSAIQVGKALNDPIKGITALSRVGVTFTQKQKDVIAQLVKTGDTAGAQKVILKELGKEFGGAAKAAGSGAAGDLARFKDSIDDTGRAIGQALLPMLASIAKWVGDKLPPVLAQAVKFFTALKTGMAEGDGSGIETAALKIRDAFKVAKKVVSDFIAVVSNPIFQIFAAAIIAVVAAMEVYAGVVGVVTAVTEAWAAVQAALDVVLTANPIGLIVLGLVALTAAIIVAYKRSETFREVVHWAMAGASAAFRGFRSVVSAVFNFVKSHWRLMASILGGPVIAAVLVVTRNFSKIRSRASSAVSGIRHAFGAVYGAITNPIRNAVNAVMSWLRGLLNFARSIPGKIGGAIKGAIPGFEHGGITGAATGGARGGTVMVGEHGRELVNLPFGSKVIPNGTTENMMGAAGGGGSVIMLEVVANETAVSAWLAEMIRKFVRVKGGGSVQTALGVK